MTKHLPAENIFEFLIGQHTPEPSEAEMDRWHGVVEAEDAFERIIGHVARTTFSEGDDMKIRLALSAVLGAWTCVLKAREAE